jgi:hypothetical protein
MTLLPPSKNEPIDTTRGRVTGCPDPHPLQRGMVMPTNAFVFRDQAEVHSVTSTELKEIFEFGFNHAGTWLFLAQGYAFADNAKLKLHLRLKTGTAR